METTHITRSSDSALIKKLLAFAQSKNPRASVATLIAALVVLCAWLILVVFTASQHEFWRDEVRALSVAQSAASPLDLFNKIHNEGHPIVWYLILYLGNLLAPQILPFAALVIALGAVAVFMFFAPFPFWLKCLFLFGVLPVYEYSVMARNYGISMLLFFVAAALYKNKSRHPVLLGVVLALLANTNIHSAMLVCLIALVWAWDAVAERRKNGQTLNPGAGFAAAFVIIAAGVALGVFPALPDDTSILGIYRNPIGPPALSKPPEQVFQEASGVFAKLMPEEAQPFLAMALLALTALGLIRRPALFLAALAGLVAFAALFLLVYWGQLRHQGIYFVFVVFLYWLRMDSANAKPARLPARVAQGMGLVALVGLLAGGVVVGYRAVTQDITTQMSSNKDLGAFLTSSEAYRDAIIVPEPDYLVESLPYYAPVSLFYPREQRFGKYVSFTTASSKYITLGILLNDAIDLKNKYGKPVLIVLGHKDVGPRQSGTARFSYGSLFQWYSADVATLNSATTLVGTFTSAVGDENYRVFLVK